MPDDWAGIFFPAYLPQGYVFSAQQTAIDYLSITFARQQDTIIFREYSQQQPVSLPAHATLSYVQWGDQIALRAETPESVLLAWDQHGHTLSLICTSGDAMEIAASVKKLGE